MNFLKKRVADFAAAAFSGVTPCIGIHETRRVMGDGVLTGEDVLQARKHPDAIVHEIGKLGDTIRVFETLQVILRRL